MPRVLVTGGCGYIGSHTLVELIEDGIDAVSLDNNVRSEPSSMDGVRAITGHDVANWHADLRDIERQHRAETPVDSLKTEDHAESQQESGQLEQVLHHGRAAADRSWGLAVARLFVEHHDRDERDHIKQRGKQERAPQANDRREQAADYRSNRGAQPMARLDHADRLCHAVARRGLCGHRDRQGAISCKQSQ